jgi:hypothetical protein
MSLRDIGCNESRLRRDIHSYRCGRGPQPGIQFKIPIAFRPTIGRNSRWPVTLREHWCATLKKRMAAKLLAIKAEQIRRRHQPKAAVGEWLQRSVRGTWRDNSCSQAHRWTDCHFWALCRAATQVIANSRRIAGSFSIARTGVMNEFH